MRGPSPRSYEVTRSVRSTSTAAPPRWSRCRSSSSASSPQAIRHSFNEATALPPSIAGVILSSSRETASRFVVYSSRSMVVPGGENVNCCRTISR